MGDSDPLHRPGSTDAAYKFKGRWGGVSAAEGIGELKLGAGLVSDLEGEAPEGGDKP